MDELREQLRVRIERASRRQQPVEQGCSRPRSAVRAEPSARAEPRAHASAPAPCAPGSSQQGVDLRTGAQAAARPSSTRGSRLTASRSASDVAEAAKGQRSSGVSGGAKGVGGASRGAGGASTGGPSRGPLRRTASDMASHVASDPLMAHGYASQSPIASGAFSTIVRAKQLSTGTDVAVKTFQIKIRGGKPAANMKEVNGELDALGRLQPSAHAHIANLVETFETEYELHAILEYCSGGSVQRHLQGQGHGIGLDEHSAMLIAAQAGCALAHMHGLGVAHRDVKPENLIFVDRERTMVRLVDFGFAALVENNRKCRTVCGSPAYMAPELVMSKPYLGPPVDVWALGALLYELLHNRVAFRAESIAQLHIRIRKALHAHFAPGISAKAKTAIKKAFTIDANERVDAITITRSLIEGFNLHIEAMPP